jgi:isocitrate dehydrogenase
MSEKVAITVANGDGIGPEIMAATMHVITEAGARIEPEYIEIGEKVYLAGNSAGIDAKAWDSIRRTKVFLKAPITTPQGGGYRSLNVTTRKAFGLYANVRPSRSYHPFVPSKHPKLDLVIIRENEEDLYAGVEHQQTPEVVQCLKLISRPGCEKIIRFAFEYARRNKRKKVTCMTKDNIMKLTDGLFHKVFDEIAPDYPGIESEHWIIDIGMAKLADTPQDFDVVVMPNLYGDIASDMVAQIAGSVGLAGSANLGDEMAMFEAIHGSAPRRANQNLANPSGLLLGGVLMLVHIGQPDVAERVHNAWLKTLEDRVFTYDLVRQAKAAGETRFTEVGTREFAQAVVDRLGKRPEQLAPVEYPREAAEPWPKAKLTDVRGVKGDLVGVDVFVRWNGTPAELGPKMESLSGGGLTFKMITNRGQQVYPGGEAATFTTDHSRCRFLGKGVGRGQIRALLERVEKAQLEWIKTELLYEFDGKPAFSHAG